jgi:putative N6-adenine-specific DNA methylase
MNFDIGLWTELRDQARRGVHKQLAAVVAGCDQRRDAVRFARDNAKAAGVGHLIQFDVKDVRDFRPPEGDSGTIVCNPPYGERLGEEQDLRPLYELLGKVFRERCRGWKACVFTGNARLARYIGLEPAEQVHLYNGKIPCRLLIYDLKQL